MPRNGEGVDRVQSTSRTDVTCQSQVIMRSMAKSWSGLARQMDRMAEANQELSVHLALAR
jgi:hypothetical protein